MTVKAENRYCKQKRPTKENTLQNSVSCSVLDGTIRQCLKRKSPGASPHLVESNPEVQITLEACPLVEAPLVGTDPRTNMATSTDHDFLTTRGTSPKYLGRFGII